MSQEYILPLDTVILSTANLQGDIISCNKGFIEASGYTEAEVLGKPHSILRHPDMPKEAFKDLWDTIEAGRPWFGLVKNLRKDGRHYWVAANASPIYTNDQISGYVSVRYPATAEQKALGERLYAEIRSGQTKMSWTPKPTFDRWTLAGIAAATIGLITPYITTNLALDISATLLAAAGLGAIVWRTISLSQPSEQQLKAIHDLGNGLFRNPIPGNDAWTNALNLIRTRIGQNASDAFDAARESAVLTTAMNAASANLMVADANFNIISVNSSLAELFKHRETHIKAHLPAFSADKVVGSNMDIFHKNPVHQRAMVSALTQPHTAELKIDELMLRLTVVPILKGSHRIGYVVEWLDVTEQRLIEEQLSTTIQQASQGIISNRINTQGLDGFYLSSAQGVNRLLDGLHQFMSKTIQNIGELAFSRINKKVEGDYLGTFSMTQEVMNTALDGLNSTLGQVQFTSQQVTSAMRQLNDGVNDFSDRIQQQAAAIEETSAATTQMLSSIQQSMQGIRSVNDITRTVTEQVTEGSHVMEDALAAMQAVEASGQQIGNIVGLIDSIAFQTNLLALNAAVEAARAGEHGRGFAVVASEVRSLAGKSAEAAKDIKKLIDTSVNQITLGSARAREANQSLEAIKNSIIEVNQTIEQVNQASVEQDKAIQEVNKAMNVLDGASQQSAALVEQTAASAEQVFESMTDLNKLIERFELSQEAKHIAQHGPTPLSEMKLHLRNWNIRIMNVLNGLDHETSVEQAADYQSCSLGKWRSSIGRQYEHLPVVKEMDVAHRQFHELAAKAVASARNHDYTQVENMIHELTAVAQKTIQLMSQVEQQLGRHSTPEFGTKIAQAKARNQPALTAPSGKALPAPKVSDEWSEF
ncbi:MAG TPA: methyl-accepting chemotaxis protein [Thiotrichales bacterium]|nr:MAG: hypothetical protein B7Y29_04395 [Thiotrichales bacterium 16-46-22]OZA19281.1 MAG: hypothetical protein B7X85_02535 [Thiotrichales bacterium 17-46-47]HQT04481.1 methyl-accepting chemotaxis protein [Thiotrichales bacterium]